MGLDVTLCKYTGNRTLQAELIMVESCSKETQQLLDHGDHYNLDLVNKKYIEAGLQYEGDKYDPYHYEFHPNHEDLAIWVPDRGYIDNENTKGVHWAFGMKNNQEPFDDEVKIYDYVYIIPNWEQCKKRLENASGKSRHKNKDWEYSYELIKNWLDVISIPLEKDKENVDKYFLFWSY